ncbi:Fc.00g015390.m01.CDS01 [Cosmosporella sp. VM-42]
MTLLDSVRRTFSRNKSEKKQEAERLSRQDTMGTGNDDNTSSWNRNPFLDPSSAAQQKATPTDAPPAYAPSPSPSTLLLAPSTNRNASPAPSLASVTTPEDKYAFLTTFDTVFVIDDSGSMAGRSWREVRDALRAITPICTDHDADGIDVYFLNHNSGLSGGQGKASGGYANVRDAAQVERLFNSVSPRGATPTGSRLQNILKPYVASLARRPDNMESIKPVNIIVITDGCPTDDPESVIVHHAKKLDKIEAPPYQVGIQFFQVGNEPGATRALRELDDDLADQGIRDMVDTVTWDPANSSRSKDLTAESILKVVLGAVVRRLDRKATSGSVRQH